MKSSINLLFILMCCSSIFGMREHEEQQPTPSYMPCPCKYYMIYNSLELIDLLKLMSKQPFEPFKPELKQEAQEFREIYRFLLNQKADEHIARMQKQFESFKNSQKNS